jgi:proteic killer suppression protein
MIDAAETFKDLLSPPSNHLEKLKGKKQNIYSIRVNKQYRLMFKWKDGNAYNVKVLDYHKLLKYVQSHKANSSRRNSSRGIFDTFGIESIPGS